MMNVFTHLEAGGDGGVLIVCSLRVSYEVVPACEHLPAEGEVAFLSSVASLVCVTSHPERRVSAVLLKYCVENFPT